MLRKSLTRFKPAADRYRNCIHPKKTVFPTRNATINWRNQGYSTLFLPTSVLLGSVYTNCNLEIKVQELSSINPVKIATSASQDVTFVQKFKDLLRKLWEYLSAAKRILFCCSVIIPAAAITPVARLVGKQEDLWDYLIWCIEYLGPTFIKMGQWAGTRPDLFPADFTSRLVKLQDCTKTHPWSVAEKTLREEFGVDWENLLEIDRKPIGSGCIAQVYKGKLKQGRQQKVAIKLIHPHIEEIVKEDMVILKGLVWLLEKLPSLGESIVHAYVLH